MSYVKKKRSRKKEMKGRGPAAAAVEASLFCLLIQTSFEVSRLIPLQD
jgi:hypothetical protein